MTNVVDQPLTKEAVQFVIAQVFFWKVAPAWLTIHKPAAPYSWQHPMHGFIVQGVVSQIAAFFIQFSFYQIPYLVSTHEFNTPL